MLRTGVGLFFGTIVLVIVLPDTTPALLYAAMVAVGGGGAFWMMGRLGAREREEFAAGYTSRTAFVGLWQLGRGGAVLRERSEEHTSELQSLMRISYAVFCLKKKKNINTTTHAND